jgi:hypothetical protein
MDLRRHYTLKIGILLFLVYFVYITSTINDICFKKTLLAMKFSNIKLQKFDFKNLVNMTPEI